MSSSTRTTAAARTTAATRTTSAKQGISVGRLNPARFWSCFMILLAFASLTASAQTAMNPNPVTNTVQLAGTPDPASRVSGPVAGIILNGTAISPTTGQPVRHLWIGVTTPGICRVDPDLDSPGPYALTPSTCPFKINGASITGGPMAFSPNSQYPKNPNRTFLYFADEQRASQGIFRLGFDPTLDGGHGLIDFASVFAMGGAPTGARFGGGQTGCPLPGGPAKPSALALGPDGNIYVGFATRGSILRFNSPATATTTGFGTCAQFIQQVATTPDNATTNGLAFLGHDLWGADGTQPFVIAKADTTCLVPPNPACTTANGTVVQALAPIGAVTSVYSDQFYPATNGNNLFFAQPTNVAWAANVNAGPAGQTYTLSYINPAQLPSPLQNVATAVVDGTDPANLTVYTGDDITAGVGVGNGRIWQSCQPSTAVGACSSAGAPAAAVPGAPLNVVAVAGNAQATVSWSPAQSGQPVNQYTVTTISAGPGPGVPPVTVNPVAPSNFPATSTLITGLTNGTAYTFTVTANNASGPSPASAPSNSVTPPGVDVPAAPTNVTAVAGDTQASVTWTVSPAPLGAPSTSYTVTATPSGITITVPAPPATSNTGNLVFGGLTNGTSYTFTVHATDSAGAGPESAPSNPPVTPSAANLPVVTIAMTGPTSVTSTPIQITYALKITNTSAFPVQSVSFSPAL